MQGLVEEDEAEGAAVRLDRLDPLPVQQLGEVHVAACGAGERVSGCAGENGAGEGTRV